MIQIYFFHVITKLCAMKRSQSHLFFVFLQTIKSEDFTTPLHHNIMSNN